METEYNIESTIVGLDRHFNYLSGEVFKYQYNANMHYSENNPKFEQERKKVKQLKAQMLECAEKVIELGASSDSLGPTVKRIIDAAQTYVENHKNEKQPGQED